MVSEGRPWFRFTGAAGNIMLNRCPPAYSCGTNVGMWTDERMPTLVGVQSSINAYRSWSRNCKYFTKRVSVMKCSTNNNFDFIYKYASDTVCTLGFCGITRID